MVKSCFANIPDAEWLVPDSGGLFAVGSGGLVRALK